MNLRQVKVERKVKLNHVYVIMLKYKIQTQRNIQQVTNLWNTHEIQIFSLASQYQKTWAIAVQDDPNVNILPPSIATSLPQTTHYQKRIRLDAVDRIHDIMQV